MESIPSFGNAHTFERVSLDWHTAKSPETLESRSSLDTIVVLVQLGIGFLHERGPPSALIGFRGSPGVESVSPLDYWKSIINIDADPSVFNPEFKSENSRFWVRA